MTHAPAQVWGFCSIPLPLSKNDSNGPKSYFQCTHQPRSTNTQPSFQKKFQPSLSFRLSTAFVFSTALRTSSLFNFSYHTLLK
jgi:hypothetical protein